MKIIKKLGIILCMTMLMLGKTVFAAEYTDTIRVGIYYGSGAVDSLVAESSDGFVVGCYNGRELTPFFKASTSLATILPNQNMWHVVYAENLDFSTAQAQAETLRNSGIDGFVAYSELGTHVWIGCFSSQEEAQTMAASLGLGGGVVQAKSNSVKMSDENGKIVFLMNDQSAELGIIASDYKNTAKTVTISGAAKGSYRGGFALKTDGAKMTVVNVVPVEKYLYGVVSREMSSSWHVEALKTQAVAARNFALGRLNYHKQYGFDVCRTTCCQAYSGISAEGENVYTAVDETSGELLMYNGELCQTVYSSSMGSETESVENVWGSKFPYLVSVENPYEDTENIHNGKWTKKLSVARATEIMENRGYDIGTVLNITALEYTPAGRVLKLKVQGTSGEKIFERETCRTIFSEATYSQKYTVSKGGVTTYPQIAVTNGKTNAVTQINAFVISSDNVTSQPTKVVYATNGDTVKKYEATSTEGKTDEFVFTGEGWGHGVGMSQYGAKGMAEAGFSYDEILKHYYTGTEIVKVY